VDTDIAREERIPVIVDAGRLFTLVTFLSFLFLAIVIGVRMWRLQQPLLAAACGGVAGFIFLLGLWFLISAD
jgi:hypothetical protein